MAWTKEQQAAIDSRGQTLLLSAAAGSGKTAVLVERIIRRLLDENQPVDITELLVVTFTKAAANEMRERVAQALMQALAESQNPRIERQLALLPSAHISTLHAFCQQVIRKYFYTIDLDPAFTIGGQEELNLLRHRVLEEVFLSYYEDEEKARILYPLADMFGTDHGDDALMEVVSRMYDYARSLAWPEDWLEKAAAAYAIPEGAELEDLPWLKPLEAEIRRHLTEDLRLYDGALLYLSRTAALQSAYPAFCDEREALQKAADAPSWEKLSQGVRALEFPRLKSLRKLSAEEKEIWDRCKKVRQGVKDDIQKNLQPLYFSVSAKDWLDGMRTMQPVMQGLVEVTKAFAQAYAQAKRERGWLDFSDLEHFCLEILLSKDATPGHPVRSAAAEELCQDYAEVLIDEYQDTNGVQELITRLVSRQDNRFMVGDIKQSIYRFRLADPSLFLEKYQTYSREEKAKQRCIDLAKNFRSAPLVLDAVNTVFARIMTQEAAGMDYGKREKLYAGRQAPADAAWIGGPVEVDLIDTEKEEESGATPFERECRFIAARLRTLLASGKKVAKKDGTLEPLSYRHIVILLRSLAGKAEVLSRALQAAGIPCYAEQSGGYFAASEVQVLLSLLSCIDNPEQDLPLAAVLRSPLAGLDETSLAALRLSGEGTLWQNLPGYTQNLPAGSEKEKLTAFMQDLDAWRTYSRRYGVAELLQKIYEDTACLDFVGAMPGGAVRQANLKALYDRARQYEEAGFRGLFRYLRLIEKMKEDGLDLAPAKVVSESEDVVRIMSIHKSKGLEFPVVIVADLGKTFNRRDTQATILFHNRLGIGIKQYDPKWRLAYPTLIWSGIAAKLRWESTAEEERVLYVALTRARDQLILTGHSRTLAQDWQRWSSQLPAAQAHSYLDWLMPSVLAALPQAASLAPHSGLQWRSDLWQLNICQSEEKAAISEAALEKEPRLTALRQGMVTGTKIPAWLDKALGYTYPYPQAVVTPAKFSVSEIKRQYTELHLPEIESETALAAAPPAITPEAEDAFSTPPAWLAETAAEVSGARRGTALHKALQYITPGKTATYASLRRELADCVQKGLLSSEESQLVYLPGLLHFAHSDLGRRMAEAAEIHREYPFTVLLSGGGLLPEVEAGEKILVQGIIDCLFREKGGWVLVDYKSDRLETAAGFWDRYRIQLRLYQQAVEQITGLKVKETYIYSLHLEKELAFTK